MPREDGFGWNPETGPAPLPQNIISGQEHGVASLGYMLECAIWETLNDPRFSQMSIREVCGTLDFVKIQIWTQAHQAQSEL